FVGRNGVLPQTRIFVPRPPLRGSTNRLLDNKKGLTTPSGQTSQKLKSQKSKLRGFNDFLIGDEKT
ncbi:hypothetical protein, partial [Limnospira indica]|uniref:hypothetical protein n=1 Tax=Limnospira indica TaxID=147322 RepID=UPI0023575F3D